MRRISLYDYVLASAVLLMVWKVVAVIVSSQILPPPEEVFSAFFESIKETDFWKDFGISAYRAVVSIVLAWSIAFPLGVIIGFSKRVDRLVTPLIYMTYPIPKLVLLPVIFLFFGLGDISKIALITLIVFFPILVSTRDGVEGVDQKYFDSMRSLGASDTDILREVAVPAALPSSFTALRITAGTAISVLFVVESFAGSNGLGYYIQNAWTMIEYTQMFVGIIGMSLLGLMLFETFALLERRVCRWKSPPDERDESPSFVQRVIVYAQMIKLSHTVFAFPFALSAVVLVSNDYDMTVEVLFWIVMSVIFARSAAMGFNRIADAAIDSRNPRTASRHIPTGKLGMNEGIIFVIISSMLFVASAGMISLLCLILSFPVLALLFAYSYTKRFTWGSHIVLGLAIGLVPMAVWVAITGEISYDMAALSLALWTYITGFDILYACQDTDFDRKEGLHSIPVRFGVRSAMNISKALHMVSVISLASLYWLFDLSPLYMIVIAVIAVLFVIEHRLVRPEDLSRMDVAFYNVNSLISLLVLGAVLIGVYA